MPEKQHGSETHFSPALSAILAINEASVYLRDIVDQVVAPLGITGGQYTILRILKRNEQPGCNNAEILRQVVDKKADITRQLDGLSRLGLIKRERLESDRRVVMSAITTSGVEALERLDVLFRDMLAELGEKLLPKQWADVAELCRAIIAEHS